MYLIVVVCRCYLLCVRTTWCILELVVNTCYMFVLGTWLRVLLFV